jgi:hypothetical protein
VKRVLESARLKGKGILGMRWGKKKERPATDNHAKVLAKNGYKEVTDDNARAKGERRFILLKQDPTPDWKSTRPDAGSPDKTFSGRVSFKAAVSNDGSWMVIGGGRVKTGKGAYSLQRHFSSRTKW